MTVRLLTASLHESGDEDNPDIEITFLDTCVYKGDRFKKESIFVLDTNSL